MKFIVGRKLSMSQVYAEDRTIVPVTIVRVGAGVVTQIKTVDTDGYAAVQVGYNEGSKHVTASVRGHVKGAVTRPYLKEFRVQNADAFSVGQVYDASGFEPGDVVSVTGTSKGRGFSGVVKRHHFSGSPKTHGHKHDSRAPGSIGSTDSARVFPGMRMAGRFGAEQVTVKNLKIVSIDAENGTIAVKGALPGPRGSVVIISGDGEMKPVSDKEQKKEDLTSVEEVAKEDPITAATEKVQS